MGKIDRYNGNLEAFAAEALSAERTVFGDTTQSDTLDANISADFLRGWGIVGVNENPTKQDFNGLAFTLGQLISYLHQRGIAEWNAAQEYFDGSVVTTLVGIYRLKSGGEGSSDPDTDDGVNWERVGCSDIDSELIPTQAEVDAKADQDTTYTKTEVDELRNGLLDAIAALANPAIPDIPDNSEQTWENVTQFRLTSGVTYTNSLGQPTAAAIYLNGVGDDVRAYVDGTQVFFEVVDGQNSFTFVIPAGSTYKCDFYPNYLLFWYELR